MRYLINNEWAQTADDVVWRRSKLGIRFTEQQMTRLDTFMNQNKKLQVFAAE